MNYIEQKISMKFFSEAEQVYDYLSDDLSKSIFQQRLLLNITCSFENLKGLIGFASKEVQDKFDQIENSVFDIKLEDGDTVIFYGAGITGIAVSKMFRKINTCKKLFCDRNYKNIMPFDNIAIISPSELFDKYKNAKIIVTTTAGSIVGKDNVKTMLVENGVGENNIYEGVCVDEENQYFDPLVKLEDNEIFLDCGGFDGSTSKIFAENVRGVYKHIHILEPDQNNFDYIQNNLKLTNVTCYKLGASVREEELTFVMGSGGGSHLVNEGNGFNTVKINVNSIDNIFASYSVEDLPTFIKMDIEGAELSALMGAKNVITKKKPKLAISVYHKNEDIIDIISYVKKLVPEYKIYLRHYTSCVTETIMYAVIG